MKQVVWILSLSVLILFSFSFSTIIEKIPKAPFSSDRASSWVLEEIEGKDPAIEAMFVDSYFFFKPQGEVKIIFDNQVEKANWFRTDQAVNIQAESNNPWLQELEGTWAIHQPEKKILELQQADNPSHKMKFKRVRP